MHTSSYGEMNYCMSKYLDITKQLDILDIGSMAVSEGMQVTYKKLISGNWNYTGLDMSAGENVDIVVKDPYKWTEVADKSYDVIISGQALEHTKYPWIVVQEMARVAKTGGLLIIIAPSSGWEHKWPIDCYRFYPDGLKALAELANIKVLECYCNNMAPWKDTVLIGRKE